ncbi:serine protease protein [mine drainage metagenome]|uniref:Serine protease protein n=1 Tax=mine drainage metagenome TaxID=410659 RepID=T1A204_9ZZZZ
MPLVFALPAWAETASQVFKQDAPSVVVVMTYNAAGKATELGSGVKLPDGSVATNCHVLKDGTRYRVRYQGKNYRATLDKSDWNRDVCSLDVPGLPAPPAVLGSTKTLQVGDAVYAIGTPEGLRHTLSEGIVSSLRAVGDGSYIQTTAAISPGSSGGGLFDDHGRLLGLTSFFITKGQQLNFALPVEWIEALPKHSTARVVSRTSEVDWLNQAAALEGSKDWSGLRVLAEGWTKAQPESAIAWVALGEADQGVDLYAQAIAANRQALKINPQDEASGPT